MDGLKMDEQIIKDMEKKLLISAMTILLAAFMGTEIKAQAYWINKDTIYQPIFTTVSFYPTTDRLGYPIIRLMSGERLVLEFDDMTGGFKELMYTVTHCDANWMPSRLEKVEYIDGFEEERLRDFAYSIATFDEYTHYRLRWPNENMDVRVSGNYLLHVYIDNEEQTPILTRRFIVAENSFKVQASLKRTTDVQKLNTHQEFDVLINQKDTRVVNALNEVNITILQNGRWDNAIYNLSPQSVRGDDMYFDYLDKIVFPAGKQFRYIDLRSVLYKTERVQEIQTFEDGIDIIVRQDPNRRSQKYLNYPDANGRFVVGNQDRMQAEAETISQYVLTHFTLDQRYVPNEDIYVMGLLSDWRIQPRFKMEYNPNTEQYEGAIMLKQGYYDYIYVTSPDGYNFDHTYIEGDWAETENDYTVIVYWRPFGERYDRVAVVKTFNSLDW